MVSPLIVPMICICTLEETLMSNCLRGRGLCKRSFKEVGEPTHSSASHPIWHTDEVYAYLEK